MTCLGQRAGMASELSDDDGPVLDDPDPLTRFGRALEESAIELLAVDQRPLPTGPRHEARPQIERTQLTPEARLHLRLLEQQRCALEKAHDTVERRLSAAERDLQRSNPLRRGHRDKLRTEIDRQHRAIEVTDARLAETVRSLEEARYQLNTVDRTPDRSPERGRESITRSTETRDPRALVLER